MIDAEFPVFYNDTVFGDFIGNIKMANMSVNYSNWFNYFPVCLHPPNLESGCIKAIAFEHTVLYSGKVESQYATNNRGIYHFTGSSLTLYCRQIVKQEDLSTFVHWYKDHQLINIQERFTRVNPTDPFNHSIIIKNLQPSDSGRYLCVFLCWQLSHAL